MFDLHLHSTASDGIDSPTHLVSMASDLGLAGMALTDHDTLSGITDARQAAVDAGIAFLPGVELSVDHRGTKIHMLVYGIEPGEGPLQDRLQELRDGRDSRNRKIVERLRELGYEIDMADVEGQSLGLSVGRPHIADALIARGYFTSRDEVFEHLLHDGGPAYLPRLRLTASEAIELSEASGGVTVIAHPVTMGLGSDDFVSAVRELRDVGLFGLEAHHPMHDLALRAHLTDLALSLHLQPTGGSDYHGAGKRTYRIGVGNGDLRVPDDAFAAILEAVA